MIKRAKEILQLEIEALQSLPLDEDTIKKVIEMIVRCEGKIVTTGVGKAGLIARKLAASLASTGTPSFFMDSTDAQHGDLGMICDKDIVIVLSNSGRTKELLLTLQLCKKTFSCPIIGITASKESKISKYCDLILEIGKVKEACPFGLAPTSSTTVMMVLGDILTVLTMEAKNFSITDYSHRHHSGYISVLIKEKIG